jgi:DNA mismatch repair protein MutL
MPIQRLSDALASQIAAGEVVERPSSVVKELIENSLDAGATAVILEIRSGGRDLIQVADNGSGIPAAEIETAFQRHATSKLTSIEDLQAIHTLGFRGEALAAIAAVSQMTVVSRTAAAEAGIRLELEAGRVSRRDQVGAPQGTVMAVEKLFYNIPARLKFLKTVATEKRLIDELITRYALAYPQVRFRLAHDGRITFQTSGSGQLSDVLIDVYGLEVARELLPLRPEEGETRREGEWQIGVTGYVGPPSRHWSNRGQITLFVNGRWIKDSQLTYAVIQAYHTLLPAGRFPLGLIFVTLPAKQVDVNVHPMKTEVRFRDPGALFSQIQRAVRETLVETQPIRSMTQFTPSNALLWSSQTDDAGFVRREVDSQENLPLSWPAADLPTAVFPEPVAGGGASTDSASATGSASGTGSASATGKLPVMRVIGQVGAAYIITEGPDGLFLIDQHAAHERILYEQFMAQWAQDKRIESQRLMTGTAVHLPPGQADLLGEHLPLLAQIGFEIEPFGPQSFMVRSLPTPLARLDPGRALAEIVDELDRGSEPLRERIEAQIVRRVCKTAAIKAGQTLSPAEMEALIQQLEACESPHTCPHGRPTFLHLSAAQLARSFGRI